MMRLCLTVDRESNTTAPAARAAWDFVRQMLTDLTGTVVEDAADEQELIEGLRVLAKVTALCTELSVEADPQRPRFFDMCSPTRLIGGPNPDGRYLLAAVRGDRLYRITGTRGSTAYLGFQVLAGTGLTPRRMAAYLGDSELECARGSFALVLAAQRPAPEILGDAQWIPVPEDASAVVVREYIADRSAETPANMTITCLNPDALQPVSDTIAGEGFTAMAWTMMKLATLHRTVKPELLTEPNRLLTAEAAELGAADTTPDNLYMIGSFALASEESLVLEFVPPQSRYWNITLENVWHECLEPHHRHSSVTNRGVAPDEHGLVRIAIGANDSGHGHWLDTGGRRRGFVVLRWLDNPQPPTVHTSVRLGRSAS